MRDIIEVVCVGTFLLLVSTLPIMLTVAIVKWTLDLLRVLGL